MLANLIVEFRYIQSWHVAHLRIGFKLSVFMAHASVHPSKGSSTPISARIGDASNAEESMDLGLVTSAIAAACRVRVPRRNSASQRRRASTGSLVPTIAQPASSRSYRLFAATRLAIVVFHAHGNRCFEKAFASRPFIVAVRAGTAKHTLRRIIEPGAAGP